MSDVISTPKKQVKKGRKLKEESANDFFRLCCCPLKIKFGNFEKASYISTESLFKESNRKDTSCRPLADLCEEILGSVLEKSPSFSTRVCKACGGKIRNAHALLKLIRSRLNQARTSSTEHEDIRYKRQLPTTIDSTDCSPQARKELRKAASEISTTTTAGTRAKRNLSLDNKCCQTYLGSSLPTEKRGWLDPDRVLSALNVDELFEKNSENTVTEVKVVIAYPSGRIDTRGSFSKDTKSLIENVTERTLKAVANIVLNHPEWREEMLETVGRKVGGEFKEYCRESTDSVLTRKTPSEIASTSNKVIVHEVKLHCPLWYSCLSGACNAQSNTETRSVKIINSIALATATAARCRNQKMSALAFRISTILFHSGVKRVDINRLNKLCVCMSPDRIVNWQKKMGENCEAKALLWKKEVKRNVSCKRLFEEVREKQIGVLEDDDMDIDVIIDFSEETIKGYSCYEAAAFKTCEVLLNSVRTSSEVFTDEDLRFAVAKLSQTRLPLYK